MPDRPSSSSLPSSPPPSPEWVRAAIAQTREEIELFVRTGLAFSLHPRRFTREWLGGERVAQNPFGFAATAVAAMSALKTFSSTIDGNAESGGGLGRQILASILPSVYFALLGALSHGFLRLLGSRRPLRDSLAIALYSTGPALAAQLLDSLVEVAFTALHRDIDHSSGVAWGILALNFLMTSVPFVVALREVHHAGRFPVLRAGTAFGGALLVSCLGFGLLDPPGSYGFHGKLRIHFTWARSLDYSYSFRD